MAFIAGRLRTRPLWLLGSRQMTLRYKAFPTQKLEAIRQTQGTSTVFGLSVNLECLSVSNSQYSRCFSSTGESNRNTATGSKISSYEAFNPTDELKPDQVYNLSEFEEWYKVWEAMASSNKKVKFDENGDIIIDDILSGKTLLEAATKKPLQKTTTFNAKPGTCIGYGIGRRKNSTARVWIYAGTGKCEVNGVKLQEYFDTDWWVKNTIEPLRATHSLSTVDIKASVYGGGKTGQSGAIRLGLSRALVKANEDLRWVLKKQKMLTRDPRMVERKKPGQKKARKKFQWVKR
mmetsp:Transcript_16030/g.19460  ORF Transcript_16030/g.19460 Transcript_16030/m.19460 type:complete len:290 (-) Transcript_16030:76-945(-)